MTADERMENTRAADEAREAATSRSARSPREAGDASLRDDDKDEP